MKERKQPQEQVRVKPHPGDPNHVRRRHAAQIHRYRHSILLFIFDMWGLVPQPVRPEYRERWEEVMRSTGDNWLKLKDTVTAEWFGEKVGENAHHVPIWHWYNPDGPLISSRTEFLARKYISWQQVLILLAFEKAVNDERLSRHISVKSGHGIGKSAVVSFVILWFLYCYFMSQVPVTAPTSTQMHDVLWKELSIWIGRMPEKTRDIYEWQHDYIRVRYEPEAWFARAKTSSKENTEALAGVHADHVLVAVDEASGVPEQVFNTAEGALTSGNVFVILISNPTRPTGYFYDSHNKNAEDWQTFSFNCEEAPLVDRKYVDRQAKRHGTSSDEYRIRVKGLFPSEGMMDDSGYLSLMPLSRIIVVPSVGDEDRFVGRKILSIDPSGEGDDECEFILRDRFRAKNILTLHTTNYKEIAEHALTFISRYNLTSRDLVTEGFGVGVEVAKEVAIATRGKIDMYIVLPGNHPKDEEKVNGDRFARMEDEVDDDMNDLYLNLRALGHFRMRKWLLAGGMLLDNDTEHSDFAAQITANKWKRTLQGNKIQMMPKKEQHKLRIPSPNKSDALWLSFLLERDEVGQSQEEREAILRTDNAIDDPYAVV